MKRLSILAILAASLSFTGCLKDTPNNDFSTVGTIVEIPYSGLENFTSSALNLPTEETTLSFVVNIASVYPLGKDIDVTLAVDEDARKAYNAQGGAQYESMPADAYNFPTTKATIKAGTRQATFSITFYASKIDPSKNFMLAISIKDASGETISGNFGTLYYHAIGNPLAGTYDNVGRRDVYAGSIATGTYLGSVPAPSPKVASPLDAETVVIDYADLGPSGWHYLVSWDGSTLTVKDDGLLDAGAVLAFSNEGSTYDPAKKQLKLHTHYTNTSGNERDVYETLTHQ